MPDAETVSKVFVVKPFSFVFPGLCWEKTSRLEAELGVLDMLSADDVEELRKRLEASKESLSQAVVRYIRLGMLAEASGGSLMSKA